MKQFIVTAWDGSDAEALDRRMAARPRHFVRARELKANGNFLFGGAMLNDEGKMIGSTMILQFEHEEGLQGWLDTEPYITEHVWKKIEVRPFRVADV